MSQTQVLILLTVLFTATAFGIGYLAKIGYWEKAPQMTQAQESKEARGLPANGKDASQDVK